MVTGGVFDTEGGCTKGQICRTHTSTESHTHVETRSEDANPAESPTRSDWGADQNENVKAPLFQRVMAVTTPVIAATCVDAHNHTNVRKICCQNVEVRIAGLLFRLLTSPALLDLCRYTESLHTLVRPISSAQIREDHRVCAVITMKNTLWKKN